MSLRFLALPVCLSAYFIIDINALLREGRICELIEMNELLMGDILGVYFATL